MSSKKDKKIQPNQRRCTVCGFFKRGKQHDQGAHHLGGKQGHLVVKRNK